MTIEGLRADAVAGLLRQRPRQSFTPHLDQLIGEADWAGRAIAPSTAALPSLASVLTGLPPWQHQVLAPGDAIGRTPATLPEALKAVGYSTTAYVASPWLASTGGLGRGFDDFRGLRGGGRAKGDLATLGPEPRLIWLHFHEPAPPYRLPEALVSRGRKRISAADLEPFRDPSVEMPESLKREAWRAYLQHVRLVDFQIGGMLEALRQSSAWPDVLLIVASLHGEEFEEHGQVGHGNNLGRATLEVPLVVKLPQRSKAGALDSLDHPSLLRLWATAAELAGVEVPPALGPSLLRPGGGSALAELHKADGTHLFSLVEGKRQLIREVVPIQEGRRQKTPPFSGAPSATEIRSTLWSWEGRLARLRHDPSTQARLARQLARRWTHFLDRERSPAEEARLRRAP